MTVTEILFTLIGPPIGRLLLTRWIGNSDVAEELTGSLRDIISKLTDDIRTQNRAERLFTEIGEGIAESLLNLFETEGIRFNEERHKEIAGAVADTLLNIKSDTNLVQILMKYDLHPSEIAHHLFTYFPHNRSLDSTEEELYKRVIVESCQRIIQITGSLPTFQAASFSKLLSQNRTLIDVVTITLDKINNLYESSFTLHAEQDLKVRRFEHEYRQAIAWKLDHVELFGLDLRRQSYRRQPLSVAYVTLYVEEKRYGTTFSVPSALCNARRVLLVGEAGSGKSTILQWIGVRSANNDFPKYTHEMNSWSNTIPFFIRLRDFAKDSTELPTPEKWVSLTSQIADVMPSGWVHEQLRSGRAVVLIDGLDEISTQRRERVFEWLSELIELYPKARYIISTRPEVMAGMSESKWKDKLDVSQECLAKIQKNILGSRIDESLTKLSSHALMDLLLDVHKLFVEDLKVRFGYEVTLPREVLNEFLNNKKNYTFRDMLDEFKYLVETKVRQSWEHTLIILRMSDAAVENFIDNWHKAVASAEGNLPGQQEEFQRAAVSLSEQLRSHSSLRQLATSPLLCAMICALHHDREQDLPKDRIALYKACLSTLIDKRDEKRGVDRSDYVKLTHLQTHRVLQDLAYWMVRNDYTAAAPKEEAEKRLSYALSQMIGIESATGQDVLRLLVERTGIVREPIANKIDFAHRTFQEFLAAEALVASGDVRSLSPYLLHPEWREVILLTSGLASQPDLVWILDKLHKKAVGRTIFSRFSLSDENRRGPHLLAIDCLSTEPILSEEAQKIIKRHLHESRPPRSLYEATIFSRAKELAVPYLYYTKLEDSGDELLAISESLILIKGTQAFEQLASIIHILRNELTTSNPSPLASHATNPHVFQKLSDRNVTDLAKHLFLAWERLDYSDEYLDKVLQPLINITKCIVLSKAVILIKRPNLFEWSKLTHILLIEYDSEYSPSEIAKHLNLPTSVSVQVIPRE